MAWRIAAALLAAGGLAAAAGVARGPQPAQIWQHFASFSGSAVAVAAVAVLLQLLAQASRLWVVSTAPTRARWPQILRAFTFGQLANLYLPARMGDVVKAGLLGKATGSKAEDFGRAAGTVFLADKLLDVATFALIAIPLVLHSPLHTLGASPPHLGTLALAAAGVVAALALVRIARPDWVMRLRALAPSIVQGTAALGRLRVVGLAMQFSLMAWGAEAASLFVLTRADGHGLDYGECLWVLVVLNLGIAVPVSFANLGTFEASVVLAMTRMGVPAVDALALAAVHHSLQLLATGVVALLLWLAQRAGGSPAASAGVPTTVADAAPTSRS